MTLGILGAGELGRTFGDVARSMDRYNEVLYYDDFNAIAFSGQRTQGGQDDLILAFETGKIDEVAIAIGYEHLKEKDAIMRKLVPTVKFANLIHPSAVIDETAALEDGIAVLAGCSIGPRSIVERGVVMNMACVLSHDAKLGSSIFCGPGVRIGGNVVVGSSCYLSIGATIGTGVHLHDGWTVAAGAVVIHSVDSPPAEKQFLAGVPARIKERS